MQRPIKLFSLVLVLFFCGAQAKETKQVNKTKKKRGILYERYLSKGELDAKLVCKGFFPLMSAEEINTALRDVKFVIKEVLQGLLKKAPGRIDEFFVINMLHVHGHIINFIEDAWVDLDTKKVFTVEKGKRLSGNVIRLARYWSWAEQQRGERLHCYKFYASCIDYLIVLIRAYFATPCQTDERLDDMENRWVHWLVERLGCKLDGHAKFGGYYAENIALLQQVFQSWKKDFEIKQETLRSQVT